MRSIFIIIGLYFSKAFALFSNPYEDDMHFDDELLMHPARAFVPSSSLNTLKEEVNAEFWFERAQNAIRHKLKRTPIKGKAKNLIMFLGDGMSIPTVTASRIFKGQKEGHPGEEHHLAFDEFPFVGLSKTYCVDSQVTDSAASATAYLTGVKANYATIGVTAAVQLGNCTSTRDFRTHTSSIAEWAQKAGFRTGLVTTARVTHASPAGLYAHIAKRSWENDLNIIKDGEDPNNCPDIATQLIENPVGQRLNVIFGGGRAMFLPKVSDCPRNGTRMDGKNLIETWKGYKEHSRLSHAYVQNRNELLGLSDEDYVLGLFNPSHMSFETDRITEEEPSLAEMTEVAIKLLSKDEKRFFLFVEGARIDMAHHKQLPYKSFEETVAFSEAVEMGVQLTKIEDTLIVVTSDHAHTMSLNGYPSRGNDILQVAGKGDDGLPYLTISYANGVYNGLNEDGHRHDVFKDSDLGAKTYKHPGLVKLRSETHGGDDVAIFSRGPWAHLLTGVNEQSTIPHIMAFAACIGNGHTACNTNTNRHRVREKLL